MWKQMLVLFFISIPGILLSVANTLKAVEKSFAQSGRIMPPKLIMSKVLLIQNFLIIIIAIVLGGFLASKSGLGAPAIEAIFTSDSSWLILKQQFFPALLTGIAGALILITFYHYFAKARLGEESISAIESLRREISLTTRVLYGGIVEEVIARWGLMSIFAFLFLLLPTLPEFAAIWLAIVASALLFAYLHLPSYIAAGAKKDQEFIMWMICQNVWTALIFGYLFWQYGLEAAIMAHIIFHIIWYPFDIRKKEF